MRLRANGQQLHQSCPAECASAGPANWHLTISNTDAEAFAVTSRCFNLTLTATRSSPSSLSWWLLTLFCGYLFILVTPWHTPEILFLLTLVYVCYRDHKGNTGCFRVSAQFITSLMKTAQSCFVTLPSISSIRNSFTSLWWDQMLGLSLPDTVVKRLIQMLPTLIFTEICKLHQSNENRTSYEITVMSI